MRSVKSDSTPYPAFGPCGIRAQHGHDAVAMLLGDPKRVAADHQVPAHGGVASTVGLAIADVEPPQGATLPNVRVLKIAEGRPGALKELGSDDRSILPARAARSASW